MVSGGDGGGYEITKLKHSVMATAAEIWPTDRSLSYPIIEQYQMPLLCTYGVGPDTVYFKSQLLNMMLNTVKLSAVPIIW